MEREMVIIIFVLLLMSILRALALIMPNRLKMYPTENPHNPKAESASPFAIQPLQAAKGRQDDTIR